VAGGTRVLVLCAVRPGAGVGGHVPPAALQLEARVRDEATDLAAARRAPVERRIGDALGPLEIAALLAPVLVDGHARAVITGSRPVKHRGAAQACDARPPATVRARGCAWRARAIRKRARVRSLPRRGRVP